MSPLLFRVRILFSHLETKLTDRSSLSWLASTGNNYGLGELRKKELLGSCEALGIDTTRCVALDHPDLQDNPKVWWDENKIKPILKEYIKKWKIDAVRPPFVY